MGEVSISSHIHERGGGLIERLRSPDTPPFFSFEFFPPKTRSGVENLTARIERMSKLNPAFVDVTWQAGGATSDLTIEICSRVLKYCGTEVVMHITCSNLTQEDIRDALVAAKGAGVRNILALRGDPPKGASGWQSVKGGFEHAADLVRFVRNEFGNYFGIAVGAYPEGHSGCGQDDPAYQDDLKYLKEKVDAGADFIMTQLFYDTSVYFRFVSDCRDIGISCPIIPGIMPIQNYRSFRKMVQYFKTKVPDRIIAELEPIKGNDAAVKAFGVNVAVEMCTELLQRGARGMHIYTLNLEKSACEIVAALALEKSLDGVSSRQLPWRPSQMPNRATEEVRPIFWANRPKSYVDRTATWDEFPNGRWGDARSPAFGDLSDTHFYSQVGSVSERRAAWGDAILSTEEVYEVFERYVSGSIPFLPWCTSKLALETGAIRAQLMQLNRKGILTINSQPKVNGIPSDDDQFGWGPRGGRVYQKAYMEFFASADLLSIIIDLCDNDDSGKYASLTYHAVDVAGNAYTNCSTKAPCAVTWGVFPGMQVKQPTVVDPESFLVWKDEAFNLWLSSWASLYEEDSQSYEVLEEIHDTYFLVNVVDNDFVSGEIFRLFNHALNKLDRRQSSLTRGSFT